MADDLVLPATSASVAADDVGGVFYQRLKVAPGPNGSVVGDAGGRLVSAAEGAALFVDPRQRMGYDSWADSSGTSYAAGKAFQPQRSLGTTFEPGTWIEVYSIQCFLYNFGGGANFPRLGYTFVIDDAGLGAPPTLGSSFDYQYGPSFHGGTVMLEPGSFEHVGDLSFGHSVGHVWDVGLRFPLLDGTARWSGFVASDTQYPLTSLSISHTIAWRRV